MRKRKEKKDEGEWRKKRNRRRAAEGRPDALGAYGRRTRLPAVRHPTCPVALTIVKQWRRNFQKSREGVP